MSTRMPGPEHEHEQAAAEPKLVRRLRAQRESFQERSRIVRWLFVAVGFTLLLGGLLMLVLPGPAFVVIPIGLAILSLQFTWAENALDKSLEQAAKAQQKASETTPAQRAMTAAAIALGAAAVAVWAIWGDIPLLPV